MVTKEFLEARLTDMQQQQQTEARQALMLSGAVQFVTQLLRELEAKANASADPTFNQ